MFVQKLCPYNSRIDKDTAYITRDQHSTRLDPRCVACSTKFRLSHFLGSRGIAIEPGQEHCCHPTCLKSPWGESKYCQLHLKVRMREGPATTEKLDMPMLKVHFDEALKIQWKPSASFKQVLDLKAKISAGKLPGGRLICLNLEFCPRTKRVFEIGIYEYISRKVIVDITVKHDNNVLAKIYDFNPTTSKRAFKIEIGHRAAHKIYGIKNVRLNGRSNIYYIASKIQKAQITQNTIIATWHVNRTDLILLPNLLGEAEYTDILPPLDNCVLMIPELKRNIPQLADNK